MTASDYIALAVPFFLSSLVAEAIYFHFKKIRAYRLADTLANLGCGMTQGITDIAFAAFSIAAYTFVYDRARVITFPQGCWAAWILAFLGVDFFYYCWHRASHRVNFIWAAHVVHHQSQEYNLSVALRQAAFSLTTSWAFYLPLAILGVSPTVYSLHLAGSLIYQFVLHTRAIQRLGALEAVLNTPSHHRVHHGVNPKYIDRNYAAILIVWDRWFGTFQKEEEEPVYGTVVPYTSWNSLWANFDYWKQLWRLAIKAPYFVDKLKVWFMPPEWKPRGLGVPAPIPSVDARTFRKWGTPPVPAWLGVFLTADFVGTLLLYTVLLSLRQTAPFGRVWPLALFSLLGIAIPGALFQRRWWGWPAEILKFTALIFIVKLYGNYLPLLTKRF